MPPFEVPVFSAKAAEVAVAHGATRLEINHAGSYAAGGLTPTLSEVAAAASVVEGTAVALRVMIRPRGPLSSGEPDFLYTDDEIRQMRSDLDARVASNVLQPSRGDGFVFGILNKDDSGRLQVDVARNRQLVDAAGPHACVFHRAADLVLGDGGDAAVATVLDDLYACGFAGVLTAGGPGARGAVEHVATLQRLAAAGRAGDTKMETIIGGGVRSPNVGQLAQQVLARCGPFGAVAFHSSCLEDAAAAVSLGVEGEGVSGDEVARIRNVLAEVK